MSTKIIVIQLREIIYTAIFVGLGIFLILLLIFMFTPKDKETMAPVSKYVPGVYTASLMLDNQPVNVEVIVDTQEINSIRFINLDPAVTTLYPLLQPSLDNISEQLKADTDLDNVSYHTDHQVTSSILLNALDQALQKAEIEVHN